MALHSGFQKVNSFTFNDLGDSLAQKKWFFGGLGPWNVKLGLAHTGMIHDFQTVKGILSLQ
jgi:hypothetical protein